MMVKKTGNKKNKRKNSATYIGGIIGAASGVVVSICLGAFVFGGVSVSNKPKTPKAPPSQASKTAEAVPTEEITTQPLEETLPPEIAAILAGATETQDSSESVEETGESNSKISGNGEIDPDLPMIALTFDDGPYLGSTEKIVDILEEYNARATFFHVGNCIDDDTKHILKREAEIGCDVENHSRAHENLSTITTNEAKESLGYTDKLIEDITGEKPIFVRPPYGAYNDTIREEDGRMFIYWSVDTGDWKSRNADAVYETVMEYVEDGDIILMHDIYDSTADAVEMLVPKLIEEGYQLVSVSELMKYRNFDYEKGTVLFNLHPVNPLYDSLHGTDTYDNPPETLPAEEGSIFTTSATSAKSSQTTATEDE